MKPLQFSSTEFDPKEKETINNNKQEVAIVGIHGVFPGAKNKEHFWNNLYLKKDLIREIPADHFDFQEWYDPTPYVQDKMYSKWGSFIDDVDKFDAAFFNISPREAEMMDPQLRYLLQVLQGTIEDSGSINTIKGSNTGLYVGVCFHDYEQEISRLGLEVNPHTGTGNATTMLANRPSFYFDLKGPSLAIDTACSSSLIALHTAVKAIQHGECDQALVAGVNLLLSAVHYRHFCSIGALSLTGRSYSFDQRADGYVPGESITSVMLKPLVQAEADGDHIYGIIKGSATTHGGYTPSITAPSVDGEVNVLLRAWEDAAINPETLGYIEAHGTGTKLGDPVEVSALKKAFKKYTKNTNFCGIGSAKGHIGHTEGAAGLVGVVKVLLSFEHEVIPAMPGFEEINPYIDLNNSPFFINTEPVSWKRNETTPLRAGVSSFGFGGAYAHVVMEEYIPRPAEKYKSEQPAIIVLSAKSAVSLKNQVRNLLDWTALHPAVSIYNLAYTLQQDRQAMEHRVVFISEDIAALTLQFHLFLEEGSAVSANQIIQGAAAASVVATVKETALLQQAMDSRELVTVGAYWVKGFPVNWNLLYPDSRPGRISLPTYPFTGERYWINKDFIKTAVRTDQQLLLQENLSNLKEQKYSSVYTGKELFFSDHQVAGKKVFPGVAYLELIKAAVFRSTGQRLTRFKQVNWIHPIAVSDAEIEVFTALYAKNHDFGFKVYTQQKGSPLVHSEGEASIAAGNSARSVNLLKLKAGFTEEIQGSVFYADLKNQGLNLGETFKGIQKVYFNAFESLSFIKLSATDQVLSALGIFDSAVQTFAAVNFNDPQRLLGLPFKAGEINFHSSLDGITAFWAHARKKETKNNDFTSVFDIDLLDQDGNVLVSFIDFIYVPVSQGGTVANAVSSKVISIYKNSWKEGLHPEIVVPAEKDVAQLVWIAGGTVLLAEQLQGSLDVVVEFLAGETAEAYFNNVFKKIKSEMDRQTEMNVTVVCTHDDYINYGFISGLLKSAHQENPKISGKVLSIDSLSLSELSNISALVLAELGTRNDEVRYQNGVRAVRTLQALTEPGSGAGHEGLLPVKFKEGGVYLITGGAGHLGLIFAQQLSKLKDIQLILTGRSELDAAGQQAISHLPMAAYYRCDVSKADEVDSLLKMIREKYQALNGVIHGAGVVRDSLLRNKSEKEVLEVLSPKINGIRNLDEATRADQLDFMIFFSSISGVLGNAGQADYAAANAYLDNYAVYRNQLQASGKRSGKTLSINWPLWKDGGMQLDAESEKYLEREWGMYPLPDQEGWLAFEQLLSTAAHQGIVFFGNRNKIAGKLSGKSQAPELKNQVAAPAELLQKTKENIISIVAELLKQEIGNIKTDAMFGNYGFDSILLTKFSNTLNAYYNLELMPTAFYNYPTIDALTAYLGDQLYENISIKHADTNEPIQEEELLENMTEQRKQDLVAIVGMNGRFPGSSDLIEFWQDLRENRDLITEIPADRWDWKTYYGDPRKDMGKTYAKWGGFIEDIDKFDPFFFGISPKEAELMDPQQRITLEAVYGALEDAGIPWSKIKGTDAGVFIGVSSADYSTLLSKQGNLITEAQASTGSAHCLLVNRISYLLDIHGPSEPVNTACSSSLIAIHKAVENIRNGHCEMAIAGGVNSLLSPEITLSFSQAGMLSEDGRCKTFDQSANGYVRGEGVGIVILKLLSQAEADGDHIYGVIRGTAENHGGKSNTLVSPNPNAQRDLLIKAYRNAGVDPQRVSYLETHGTGTALGDPIEAEGLKLAFQELYKERNLALPSLPHCALGSVKTNIGHLESAAGIAGVMKVLLAMKYNILPGNPHLKTPNGFLKLDGSPFYLQQETTVWPEEAHQTKIAGISSFGFGGSNAHIIIEEYKEKGKEDYQGGQAAVIVLSARNAERLNERAAQLKNFLTANPELKLHDIAYTLQVGRESMDERLAFEVKDKEELNLRLDQFIAGQQVAWLSGNVKKGKVALERNEDSYSLVELWVKGHLVNWNNQYPENKPTRISLPVYPFARERYWFDSYQTVTPAVPVSTPVTDTVRETVMQVSVKKKESIWDSEEIRRCKDHVVGDEILVEMLEGGIALVRMESRESKNMFTTKFILSLQKTFLDLRSYQNLKTVILTGYENIFAMGGSEEMLRNIAEMKNQFTDAAFLYRGLLEFDVPVISAIQGHAFGGGLLFGLYGDIVLLSEQSTYTANFMKYGFTPGMGATFIIGEKLGKPLAVEMMYTAKLLNGAEIKKRGASVIVTKDVLKEALQLARELSTKPRIALMVLKQKMSEDLLAELDKHIRKEAEMHELTFHTEEVKSLISRHFSQTAAIANKVAPVVQAAVNGKVRLAEPTAFEVITESPSRVTLKDLPVTDLPAAVFISRAEPLNTPALSEIISKLKGIFEKVLHIPEKELDTEATFKDFGLDSINGVEIIRSVNDTFGLSLEAVMLYDYHTLILLSDLIAKELRFTGQGETLLTQVVPEEKNIAARLSDLQEEPIMLQKGSAGLSAKPVVLQVANPGTDISGIIKKLKGIFEKVLHIPEKELDEEATFVDFGLDSINGVEIIRSMNDTFGLSLEAVMLYDYHTLILLADLVAKESGWSSGQGNQAEELVEAAIVPAAAPVAKVSLSATTEEIYNMPVYEAPAIIIHDVSAVAGQEIPVITTNSEIAVKPVNTVQSDLADIAVIGMSGRFPDAANTTAFWNNLKTGKNSIREVPSRKLTGERVVTDGQWMGSLDGEDLFDPSFFNISRREAERMDPQQRVFLEESWKAIEDSGYSGSSLSGSKCGVFVGVGQGDYTSHFKQSGLDSHLFTGASASILAARISYYLNLKGPAISIDTACSSSLVAIHQACQSIRSGECTTALAGGVYVMTTAQMLIMTSKSGMLSKDGQCYTFDHRADGFVPGEAAGVLMLKSVTQAERDGDHIYGVIKGSGINQDGKTNGITAPSIESQVRLEQDIYEKWKIDPSTISYVEAHGTGTQLGDPIEVKALKDAFRPYGAQKNSCGLGSVKTNIGHTLTAAGVCGVIKVLLGLKYRQLPPSLNFEKLNGHIELENSPFYVIDALQDWETVAAHPRRAAVSSFGFSGTNAHLVIEEYEISNQKAYQSASPAIILLSAKNTARLNEVAVNLLNYLKAEPLTGLHEVAYTLQAGREAMDERFAAVAGNSAELINQLTFYLEGKDSQQEFYTGNIKSQQTDFILDGGAGEAYINYAMQNRENKSLAQLWVKGVKIDWTLLYTGTKPKRISLPVYPFAKESYWVPEEDQVVTRAELGAGVKQRVIYKEQQAVLHPLLHQNESTLSLQKYSSTYTGEESFLADHQVNGVKVLPGVAYLEMAREAGEKSIGQKVTQLKEVTWLRPVQLNDQPKKIEISLVSSLEGAAYEIYSKESGVTLLHSQGKLTTSKPGQPQGHDLSVIHTRLKNRQDGKDYYQSFSEMGLKLGASFQGIKKLYYSDREALSIISLSKQEGFVLLPGLMDSALQTCMAMNIGDMDYSLALPFSIREVTIYQELPATVWSYARKSVSAAAQDKVTNYDIDILDQAGEILVSFRDFAVLPVNGFQLQIPVQTDILYTPVWKRTATVPDHPVTGGNHLLVTGLKAAPVTLAIRDFLKSKAVAVVETVQLGNLSAELNDIYLLQGLTDEATDLTEGFASRELAVFQSVRVLLASADQQKELNITVFTRNTQQVMPDDRVSENGSGIIGLMGSLVKEQPLWNIRVIDLDDSVPDDSAFATILAYPADKEGAVIGYRKGFLYKNELYPLDLPVAKTTKFRKNGVYVLLGGAGGIGKVTAAYLIETYHAQVIWLGRRAADAEILEAQSALEKLGCRPAYICCDGNDRASMDLAYQQIKTTYGAIHGLFHSAIVLNDMLLRNMSEADFLKSFLPKSQASHHFVESFRNEPLDFICFYSSVQSQWNAAGQGNYSAGCTYKDSYARAVSARYKLPVHIINWGYWGEVGIVASKAYQERLELLGIGSISAQEGMHILETVLASEQVQVIANKLIPHQNPAIQRIDLNRKVIPAAAISKLVPVTTVIPVFESNAEAESLLKEICEHGLLNVIAGLGETPEVEPKYKRLFTELTDTLASAGYLSVTGNKLSITAEAWKKAAEFNLEETLAALVNMHPEYEAHCRLLKVCLSSLKGILIGEIKATEVIFPEGSLINVSGIYKGNYLSDYFNGLLADFIEGAVSEGIKLLKDGEKIRILEVGAGTGGTSELLFTRLVPYRDHIEYVYTDLSKSFLLYAEEKYKNVAPYLETALFNIEKAPDLQQIAPGSCDIVIGANVVHATKDIGVSLRNIKAVLKKNGLLILNEIGKNELFNTVTFGLLDGWWLYEDQELRLKGSPGLSAAAWKIVCNETGFENSRSYPEGANLPQQIITAKSDGLIRIESTQETKKEGKKLKSAVPVSKPASGKAANHQRITEELIKITSETIKFPADEFEINKRFTDYGFDSILGTSLVKKINEQLNVSLRPTDIFNYSNVKELSEHIIAVYGDEIYLEEQEIAAPIVVAAIPEFSAPIAAIQTEINGVTELKNDDIAIIAVNGKFPDADNPEELWSRIESGEANNTAVEVEHTPYFYNPVQENDYQQAYGNTLGLTLDNYSALSRQQKLIFGALGDAMQDAKITKESLSSGKTGVFIGALQIFPEEGGINDQGYDKILSHMIPNKISFHLNLKGPSDVINTACTSVYVALHKAIQSIQLGECDQAIVGGVNVISTMEFRGTSLSGMSELWSQSKMTQSFGDVSSGFIRSEGVGIVIIKSLAKAQQDKDNILALVKGSAVIHGGKGFSLEAPNAKGIKEAVKLSLKRSGVNPAHVDFIEAHGIANRLADAIELSAINDAYKELSSDPEKTWFIGSVKPTVGHPELASGVASIIKVIKAFQHQTIPGIAGLGKVNSELDPEHTMVLEPNSSYWKNGKYPRRAALNSYAIGGVNAHLILEEYHHEFSEPEPVKERASIAQTVAPVTYESRLSALVEEVFELRLAEIDRTSSPVDYDFDSVKMIRFVREYNELFELNLKIGQVLGADNFGVLLDLLDKTWKNSQLKIAGNPDHQIVATAKYPLAEGQKGLWFIQLAEPDCTAYNVPVAVKMKGDFNPSEFQKAFELVVDQYPVLKVRFAVDELKGEVFQEVKNSPLLFEVRDFDSSLTITEELNLLLRIPFDLAQDGLVRMHIRTDPAGQETYFLLVLHHIVFDGTSAALLISSLFSNYYKLINGQAPDVQEIDSSYFDFVKWEQEYIKSEQGQDSLAYWRQKLSGSLPKLALPYELNSSTHRNVVGTGCSKLEIKEQELIELKKIAKQFKVNLSVLILTVFKILLSKLTGEEDIIIVTPVAGRPKKKFEQSIGYYVNMMIHRSLISAAKPFSVLLDEVKSDFLNGIDHAAYPYSKLISDLNLNSSAERIDSFKVSYAYQNVFDQVLGAQELFQAIEIVDEPFQELEQEYHLEVYDWRKELVIHLKYSRALFGEETIDRHLTYISRLLSEIIKDPDREIKAYDILSEEEKSTQLTRWNDTDSSYPKDKTIVDFFEQQVRQTPDHIAVVFEGTSFTYTEVNELSNQLADHLITNYSVKPDDFIGIKIERSEWMVISILGILKSGGAYVPVDPAYPQERIDYIINDSAVKAVIDAEELARFIAEKSNYSIDNPVTGVKAEHCAYVIYTSGTTGKPKGVMLEHKNVVRLLKADHALFDFNAADVWTMFHSYCFDFSVWEMYGALLFGGKLVVVPKLIAQDADLFTAMLKDEGVTILNQTPSSFYNIIDSEKKNAAALKLRYVIFGGEALRPERLQSWKVRYPKTRLVNMYGITETTVHVTYKELGTEEIESGVSNIGKPIPTLSCYILDEQLNLIPGGCTGELYVAGAGLARGYVNLAALTAERFIPNPFQTSIELRQGINGRLYKTGDLARYLTDGDIAYLGRNDFQVKIRGYRIELGEIENKLAAIPGISQVVVVAKGSYLVAYYVAENKLDVEVMMELMSHQLPEYMIPSIFVHLQAFPLTSNGKLDRKALPEPELTNSDTYVAPENELEAQLCGIYAVILGLEESKIGIDDDFFRLGGDSIISIRLISKLNLKVQTNLKVKDLFSLKTIRKIAEFITNESEYRSDLVYQPYSLIAKEDYATVIDTGEIEDIYPAAYLQLGMLFESDIKGTYHDVFRYRVELSFEQEKFLAVWAALIRKHALLRAAFVPSENGYDCVVYQNIKPSVQVFEGEVYEEIIKQEKSNAFDFSQPGLFRLIVCKYEKNFDFILSFHHCIADGWSIASLMNEFVLRYSGQVVPVINTASLSYGEFTSKEINVLKSADYKRFWTDYLPAGALNIVQWKNDREKSETGVFRTVTRLNEQEAAVIHRMAKARAVSTDSLFIYLYLNTLARFLNQQELVIGLVVNNRLEKDGGDSLFGLFLNTIPFKHEISAENNITDIFNQKVELFNFKEYPYGKIKELYGQELYQFAFNFVHFHVLKDSIGSITEASGFERTNIPFLLTVSQESETGFEISITAHDDFISQDRLDYFMRYYRYYLDGLIADQLDFNSLIPGDADLILKDFNSTGISYTVDQTVVELFEQQVVKSPENIAVVFQDHQLDYRELNALSNQLGNYLKTNYGVSPDDLVGISLAKSDWIITAIMGVLKSAGAYVPVDPDLPEHRMNYIIQDSQCKVVIDQLLLDNFLQVKDQYDAENITLEMTPDNLAYCIYTSGSTGNPKGCLITHRALASRLAALWEEVGFGADEIFLQYTNFAFDVSVGELIMPLIRGAKIVCCTREVLYAPELSLDLIESERITSLHIVPSVLKVINQAVSADVFRTKTKSLRRVLAAGEPLSQKQTMQWHLENEVPLWNLYGPTEATIYATKYQTTGTEDVVLIGKPLNDTSAYILDLNGNFSPVGVPGELCIGGAGLATGYLNRADLTAEKFIEHPYLNQERIYRTGDLVRWMPDGNIDYLGRLDDQVKIRGYRIEPGEIENCLLSSALITECVVVMRGEQDQKRLVAYLVAAELDKEGVQAYLKAHLPDYMIPAQLIELTHLPLSSNGKIDRRALPDADFSFVSREYTAPSGQIEEVLVRIWQGLLKIEVVGVQDDFFELGGHSLLAMKLVSAIKKEFGREVTLKEVFNFSTIREFAGVLLKTGNRTPENKLPVSADQVSGNAVYPVLHQQKKEYLRYLLQGKNSSNLKVINRLKVYDEIVLQQVLSVLLARHEGLRTVYTRVNGLVRQRILTVERDYIRVDVMHYPELSYEELISQKPEGIYNKLKSITLDLENGPVVGFDVIHIKDESVLVLTMHHLNSDHNSVMLLTNEIDLLYKAFQHNLSNPLDLNPVQYKDYGHWVSGFMQSDQGEINTRIYRNKIGASLSKEAESSIRGTVLARKPYDQMLKEEFHRLADNQTGLAFNEIYGYIKTLEPGIGESYSSYIRDPLLNSLQEIAVKNKSSLFNTLVATFALLISEIQDKNNIRVQFPLAARGMDGADSTVGWLTNDLILCLDLDTAKNFEELVHVVQDEFLELSDHQFYPVEKLMQDFNIAFNELVHCYINLMTVPGIVINDFTPKYGPEVKCINALKIFLLQYDNGVEVRVDYDKAIYSRKDIEAMMAVYLGIVESIVQ